jgi:hypothetical protein
LQQAQGEEKTAPNARGELKIAAETARSQSDREEVCEPINISAVFQREAHPPEDGVIGLDVDL